MQLQNSYIFLPNPHNKKPTHWKDNKGMLHIEKRHSIYSYIIKEFPRAKKEHIDGNIIQQKYSVSIEIDRNTVGISVISRNVGECYYINIAAEGKTKVQSIRALETFHNSLFSSGIEEEYISIISYDAISEYYCNKLYPKLNELERNLRKLLFNIYVLNFGREYYQATTTKEMQDKAKGLIRARGGKAKQEIVYIQQYFYSLEYADIQKLLFIPRWTKIDEANKADFLKEHPDLSQLSDEELRTKINDISPKSDWERFFAEKFNDANVESEIETVRFFRNNVAHCKFLCKEDYIACDKKIRELNRAIQKAITISEEKDFIEKSEEYLRNAFSGISSQIHELTSKMGEIFDFSIQGLSEFAKVTSSISEKIRGTVEASNALETALKGVVDIYPKLPKIDFTSLHGNLDTTYISNQDEESISEKDVEDGESENNEDA